MDGTYGSFPMLQDLLQVFTSINTMSRIRMDSHGCCKLSPSRSLQRLFSVDEKKGDEKV